MVTKLAELKMET